MYALYIFPSLWYTRKDMWYQHSRLMTNELYEDILSKTCYNTEASTKDHQRRIPVLADFRADIFEDVPVRFHKCKLISATICWWCQPWLIDKMWMKIMSPMLRTWRILTSNCYLNGLYMSCLDNKQDNLESRVDNLSRRLDSIHYIFCQIHSHWLVNLVSITISKTALGIIWYSIILWCVLVTAMYFSFNSSQILL